MTIRTITKSLALLATAGALTAHAGVAPSAPAPAPAPVSTSLWSGSVTLGYDSEYIYRGLEVFGDGGRAKNLVSGAFDLNYAINDRITWNFNAWYASSAENSTDYNELNLYTRLNFKLNDTLSIGPSFKYYYYPFFDGGNDEQYEPGVELTWAPNAGVLAGTTVNVGAFYETESEAFYFELGVNHAFKINDQFSIVPGAVISYLDRDSSSFGASASDFNHAAVYIRAPYAFKPNFTVTPYIQWNIPLDAIDDITAPNDQDDRVFGGVTVSVGF